MSRRYGPWRYRSGNGMRVIMDVTRSRVTANSNSVTYTIVFSTQNQWRYNDRQYLHYTGDLSGTTEYWNSSGTNGSGGGIVRRATRTYTYTYPSNSYGSSPGEVTFGAWISETYNGVRPEVSGTWDIPARPIKGPDPTSDATLIKQDNRRLRMTWKNNSTRESPYSSLRVQYMTNEDGVWRNEATLPGGATSYVKSSGVLYDTVYRFRVRAQNSAGQSGYDWTNQVATDPSRPRDVTSRLRSDGSAIVTSWTDISFDPTSPFTKWFRVQRRTAGGSWTNVGPSKITTTSWTDTNPGPGVNQYRVRVESDVTPGVQSLWAEGNEVSTVVPPLAPTELALDQEFGNAADFTKPQTLTWQHNHGGDGAEQSHFSIEYSEDGGASWIPLATNVASTTSAYTVPAGTLTNRTEPYLWRVQTQGATTEGFGPWSASETLRAHDTPVVTLTSPEPETNVSHITATWTYSQAQGIGQVGYIVRLYAADGVTLLEENATLGLEQTYTFDYRVMDATEYVVTVQAYSLSNMYSNTATVTTLVSLPVPSALEIDVEFGECSGTTVLTIASTNTEPIAPTMTNLATNPSAEIDLTGWSKGLSSAVLSRDTTRAYSGSASVRGTWGGDSGAVLFNVTGLTEGEVYTATMRVWVPFGHTPVQATAYFNSIGDQQTEHDIWQEIGVSFTADGTSQSVGISTSSSETTDGQWALVDGLIVVEGPEQPGTYFDGSTPDLPNRNFTWTGEPHASTSTAVSRMEIEPTSAIVERRIGGGEWVTLADNLTVPSYITDPLPNTTGQTQYRVTAVSNIPSYREMPVISVEGPDGGWKDTAGYWGYLSWGDGFSIPLRLQGNLSIEEKRDRARAVQPFLGRKRPVLMTGDNTDRVVTIKGSLYYDSECGPDDPEDCRYSSSPEEFLDAGESAGIVCWRDWTGRRVFGSISDVDASNLAPGVADVSFAVTEADYAEQYDRGEN